MPSRRKAFRPSFMRLSTAISVEGIDAIASNKQAAGGTPCFFDLKGGLKYSSRLPQAIQKSNRFKQRRGG